MAKTRKTPPSGKGAAKSTVSGPRQGPRDPNGDGAVAKMRKTQALAAAFPFNRNKADEIGDGLGPRNPARPPSRPTHRSPPAR